MKKALLLTCISLLMTGAANAGTIFSQSLTGAGLLTDSNVTVHETGVVNGSSLDFTTRSVSRGALFTWDILGASSYNDLTVTVNIDHTALNGPDNDLFIGITDGTNVVAPTRIDGFGGAINIFQGTVGGSAANPSFTILPGGSTLISSLGAVDPVEYSVLLPSAGTAGTLLSVEEDGSTATNIALTQALNTSNGLQIMVFGDGNTEDYAINSISVTVNEADISEPGALAVFGLGLFTLGYMRRRRSV
jgi:hypothetical protein